MTELKTTVWKTGNAEVEFTITSFSGFTEPPVVVNVTDGPRLRLVPPLEEEE